ncbi:MAG: endonuclease III domain-containing protein [Candidatus Omnitrophica bacterium]|nr:endonuclease III domain-containing protein [Candidatus Omnitrophota bacterium]
MIQPNLSSRTHEQEIGHKLKLIYNKLYSRFGPQYWWPADSLFEVIVGAILTQNTSWLNAEKAISNLKKEKVLSPRKLHKLKLSKLTRLIKPSGYYNIKAKRLKEFLRFFVRNYQASINKLALVKTDKLREEFLLVNGIGPETADSILLYALDKPVFVIDAYTKRIFSRHGLLKEEASYEETQNLFSQNLKKEVKLFNEYHALLVRLAKDFCLKSKPRCQVCPLGNKRFYR